MDKNKKNQFDFAEFFGAMTLLKTIIDSSRTSMKNNPIIGYKTLDKWLTRLYNDKMGESLKQYQNLMESLKQQMDEISEDE